jgi:hypothetical protein
MYQLNAPDAVQFISGRDLACAAVAGGGLLIAAQEANQLRLFMGCHRFCRE